MAAALESSLFSPLTLRGHTFRNRLWVAPMCQYSVENQDGVPTDWHLVSLGSQARGGAGLVIAEATAVVPEGRITAWDTGVWNDAQRAAWEQTVRFIHAQGAKAGLQLAHAGRKGSTYRSWSGRGTQAASDGGWQTVGPSDIPFPGLAAPRELTAAELADIVEAFRAATRRAVDAGFDVVEVHAAHGYLIHEFLSPLPNARSDEYGGSLDNRSRLLLDIVRAVRSEAGDSTCVFVRLSATDWAEPAGWTLEDATQVSGWCLEAGADLIDVSSGGNVAGVKIPTGPGYLVPFAAAIREATGGPVSAVGQITQAHQAEKIVASGQADAVLAGREFLRDPHFALRAAHQLGVDADLWPHAYSRGAWPA